MLHTEKMHSGPTPLSHAQERLWFLDQLGLAGSAYNIPMGLRLTGPLDVGAVELTLNELVRRHESLRTRFEMQEGTPHQVIDPPAPVPVERVSAVAGSGSHDRVLRSYMQQQLIRPFDLRTGPLLRACLIRLAEDEHVLLLTMHHIVSDGWSLEVIRREFGILYTAYSRGNPSPLRALPVQYADYALRQRSRLQGEELERQLKYWRDRLADAPPQLDIPTDRPRPATESFRGARVAFDLPNGLMDELRKFARERGGTPFMVCLAAFKMLLARWSGQTDIVVGAPIAGRVSTDVEDNVGFFVNTLALRTQMSWTSTFDQLLSEVRDVTLGAFAHQEVPFEALVKELRPERSLTRQPLFQAMLALQNFPESRTTLPSGLTCNLISVERTTTHFDLTLFLYQSSGRLTGELEYATDLFDEPTIRRMISHFCAILQGALADPHRELWQIRLIGDDEKRQLLAWNSTAADARDCGIHEILAEQVWRTPHAEAVVYQSQSLTYAELNTRANRLARYLRERGVRPDDKVGICMERGVELVVALLGTLKAGAAYVPFDPTFPRDRLQYMLESAAPRFVLTDERLRSSVHSGETPVILLDAEHDAIDAQREDDLQGAFDPGSLVYVIYTSGSTGRPKGIAMPHRAVANLIEWHRRCLPLIEGQRVLQFAALSFDVAFQEVFSTLCGGGTLVMLDDWVRRDPGTLNEFLNTHRIERLFVPPMMLQSLAEYADSLNIAPLSHLRHVIAAGEQLRISEELRRFFQKMPGCCLHNHYGPTETHVVTALTLRAEDGEWPTFPSIGRPISNTQIHVLDAQRQPVPIGAVGEIYIGGRNVARGYLHQPDLTAERFIDDPFSQEPGARLYRTGDLGRWQADGLVQYLGRNDDQVKIRGYRVELGEIEGRLARHPNVREVAVVARQSTAGGKHLVAYVTSRGERPAAEELRSYLKPLLPEYMIPSAFVSLERLPLTPTGKLDRRALPDPERSAFAMREYEAPKGSLEQIVADIWRELLHVERVGRHDNFFELGGHSLLLVQMLGRLRKAGLTAEVRRVYETQTLAGVAELLTTEARSLDIPPNLIPPDCEAITPDMLPLITLEARHIERIVNSVAGGVRNIQDIYPLTPLQAGMLFHHLMKEHRRDAYARSALVCADTRDTLEAYIAALQVAIDRHDVLRTAVLWDGLPQPVQVVCREATLGIEEIVLDRSGDPVEQLLDAMENGPGVMLHQAPLMRLQIARDVHGPKWYALLRTHHLIFDNESMTALMNEVAACLQGELSSAPPPAPYRNHVARLIAGAQRGDADRFFRRKLADLDEPTAPFGLLDVRGDGTLLEDAECPVASTLAQRIRVQARRAGVSAAVLFQVAWALIIARASGRDDVVYGCVLSGRLEHNDADDHALGMFVNALPLRLTIGGLSARELVGLVQRELAELLGYEHASLIQAQRCSGLEAGVPLFTSLFNFVPRAIGRPERVPAVGISLIAKSGRTNYPLSLTIYDDGESFQLHVQADGRIGATLIAESVTAAMQSLTQALEDAPHTLAVHLEVLSAGERHKVVTAFNALQAPVPSRMLVHELFERQVAQSPDAPAAIYGDKSFSYAELNRRANRLARYLRKSGVRPDSLVAVFMNRSPEWLIGLLAILKAGGAYVPMDAAYPRDRLAGMLHDCAPVLVLTEEQLKEALPGEAARVVTFERTADEASCEVDGNLSHSETLLRPEHLAYVIYTSGSTGAPKGVMVEHRNVMNLIVWHCAAFDYRHGLRCLCAAALGFDASAWEVWPALSSGAVLTIAPSELTADPDRFIKWWAGQRLDVCFLPTPLAELMFSSGIRNRDLQTLLIGGDRLRSRAGSEGIVVVNNYGPTESTVVATSGRLEANDPVLHIGRPIANTQIYILDANRQPVPIGVAGEMHIGGKSVARGYLNRPDLTAERFLPDPFAGGEKQGRLYRTGDLARWRPDGTIEYVGRNDTQVKIRGYRIELGEIEVQLSCLEPVKEAIVLAREDIPAQQRLVAYVVPADAAANGALLAEVLRASLRMKLPDYMVPSAFVIMDRLPLTPHGKVDRRALPQPDSTAYTSAVREPPRSEMEQVIAEIWKELLGVEPIGREDNFFILGGHSLTATRMIAQLRERLEVQLPLSALFEGPTIAELAIRADAARTAAATQEQAWMSEMRGQMSRDIEVMPEEDVLAELAALREEMESADDIASPRGEAR